MNHCEKYHDMFIEAFYDELSIEQEREFKAHLDSCPECAEEYSRIESTLKVMSLRTRKKQEPKFWDRFWDQIEPQLEGESQKIPRIENRWLKRKPLLPTVQMKWVYQAAAAVGLIFFGILVGRFYLSPDTDHIAEKRNTQIDAVQAADLNNRTEKFLGKSKILLLGLVNYDNAEGKGKVPPDLIRRQKISQNLVEEAQFLRAKFEKPRHRRLYELILDLEIILIQIANLEEKQNLSSVDLIKMGAERKGLLLKIDLEEIRRVEGQEIRPEKKKQKTQDKSL